MPFKSTFPVRRALLLVCASTAVILLTTLPQKVGLIRAIHDALPGSSYGDLIGHMALFGGLAALIYAVVGAGRGVRLMTALWIAVGMTIGIGTITEWAQQFSAGRSADRADLMANLLGVFIAATLILSAQRRGKSRV